MNALSSQSAASAFPLSSLSTGSQNLSNALSAQNMSQAMNAQKSAAANATGGPGQKPDKYAAAAKDFEAVFISEMLSHMFEGVQVDPMFGGGEGEKMFRGMLVQQYGKAMAQGKGIGIADQVKKMMIQMQEGSHAAGAAQGGKSPNRQIAKGN